MDAVFPFSCILLIYSACCFCWQSTEKVIISEFMDGIRLNDIESLEAFGVDKQKVIEEITRAYAHQIYIDGFFNGDPHPGIPLPLHCFCFNSLVNKFPKYYVLLGLLLWVPFAGNFLVSKEPPHRPVLLDFGLTKKLSSSFKKALAKMFLASAEVCANCFQFDILWLTWC